MSIQVLIYLQVLAVCQGSIAVVEGVVEGWLLLRDLQTYQYNNMFVYPYLFYLICLLISATSSTLARVSSAYIGIPISRLISVYWYIRVYWYQYTLMTRDILVPMYADGTHISVLPSSFFTGSNTH